MFLAAASTLDIPRESGSDSGCAMLRKSDGEPMVERTSADGALPTHAELRMTNEMPIGF